MSPNVINSIKSNCCRYCRDGVKSHRPKGDRVPLITSLHFRWDVAPNRAPNKNQPPANHDGYIVKVTEVIFLTLGHIRHREAFFLHGHQYHISMHKNKIESIRIEQKFHIDAPVVSIWRNWMYSRKSWNITCIFGMQHVFRTAVLKLKSNRL